MLVSFITEITGTDSAGKNFDLFTRAIGIVGQSSIGEGRFKGTHFDQNCNDERTIVPFFGYDYANKDTSPLLPDYKPEHGIARWFGGYGSFVGEGIELGAVYQIPMKAIKWKGKKLEILATITICSVVTNTEPQYELTKIVPVDERVTALEFAI